MHGAAGMTLPYAYSVSKIGERFPMWGKRPFRGNENIKFVTVILCNLNLFLVYTSMSYLLSF